MEQDEHALASLCRSLHLLDTSLGFLLIIIASVLLSFQSASIQREALKRTLCGEETADLPDTYPISRRAGSMVVGSLGFFLCLALNSCREAAQGSDAVAKRSAWSNLLASALVLTAAIIRLNDLNFVSQSRQILPESGAGLENSVLPD